MMVEQKAGRMVVWWVARMVRMTVEMMVALKVD